MIITQGNSALRIRITAMVLALASVIVLMFSSAVRHQLALSFSRLPQPFTELYFTGPPVVTKNMGGQFDGNVAFGVANHEGGLVSYGYVVSFFDDGRVVGRATGRLSAAADQTVTTEATVPIGDRAAAHAWDVTDVRLSGGSHLRITYRHTTE